MVGTYLLSLFANAPMEGLYTSLLSMRLAYARLTGRRRFIQSAMLYVEDQWVKPKLTSWQAFTFQSSLCFKTSYIVRQLTQDAITGLGITYASNRRGHDTIWAWQKTK